MSEQPNIILINCDDLGYGDLGCYGSTCNKTPNLDKLAAEGNKFTQFYMGSSCCSPSRGAMMTGCHPCRIGFDVFDNGAGVLFPGNATGLHPHEKTVATLLKESGYATKLIGKWHCGDQQEFLPTSHGFDEYFGIPYSNDMGRQMRPNGDVSHWPPLPLVRGNEVYQEQPDQRALTERYTYDACDFIERKKDQPFFLYFAHMHVHVPIFVPKRFLDNSDNGGYGAAVEEIDWSLGVIWEQLKKLGLDENTLIVFTSDNGSRARDEGGSNGICRGQKGTTWEGGIRVPCIMRWPQGIKAGQVTEEVTTAMDFMPTFVGLAGGEVPNDRVIDGFDIHSLMTGEAQESPTTYYPYYQANQLEAIRDKKWKLHFYKRDQVEDISGAMNALYDLENDPSETINLYDQYPEIVARLSEEADKIRHDLGDSLQGIERDAARCRLKGKVKNPKPMTFYREDYPYAVAEYDLADMDKCMAG